MSINTEVICDGCNRVINKTQNINGWYFKLSLIDHSEYPGGMVLDVFMIPPLDTDKQFHGSACLKKWVDEKK